MRFQRLIFLVLFIGGGCLVSMHISAAELTSDTGDKRQLQYVKSIATIAAYYLAAWFVPCAYERTQLLVFMVDNALSTRGLYIYTQKS